MTGHRPHSARVQRRCAPGKPGVGTRRRPTASYEDGNRRKQHHFRPFACGGSRRDGRKSSGRRKCVCNRQSLCVACSRSGRWVKPGRTNSVGAGTVRDHLALTSEYACKRKRIAHSMTLEALPLFWRTSQIMPVVQRCPLLALSWGWGCIIVCCKNEMLMRAIFIYFTLLRWRCATPAQRHAYVVEGIPTAIQKKTECPKTTTN